MPLMITRSNIGLVIMWNSLVLEECYLILFVCSCISSLVLNGFITNLAAVTTFVFFTTSKRELLFCFYLETIFFIDQCSRYIYIYIYVRLLTCYIVSCCVLQLLSKVMLTAFSLLEMYLLEYLRCMTYFCSM